MRKAKRRGKNKNIYGEAENKQKIRKMKGKVKKLWKKSNKIY